MSYVKLIILYIFVCPSKKIYIDSFISMNGSLKVGCDSTVSESYVSENSLNWLWFNNLGSSGDMRLTEQFC